MYRFDTEEASWKYLLWELIARVEVTIGMERSHAEPVGDGVEESGLHQRGLWLEEVGSDFLGTSYRQASLESECLGEGDTELFALSGEFASDQGHLFGARILLGFRHINS